MVSSNPHGNFEEPLNLSAKTTKKMTAREPPGLIPIKAGSFSKYFQKPLSLPFRRRSVTWLDKNEGDMEALRYSGSSGETNDEIDENNQNEANQNRTNHFDWVKFAAEKRLKFEQFVNRNKLE